MLGETMIGYLSFRPLSHIWGLNNSLLFEFQLPLVVSCESNVVIYTDESIIDYLESMSYIRALYKTALSSKILVQWVISITLLVLGFLRMGILGGPNDRHL